MSRFSRGVTPRIPVLQELDIDRSAPVAGISRLCRKTRRVLPDISPSSNNYLRLPLTFLGFSSIDALIARKNHIETPITLGRSPWTSIRPSAHGSPKPSRGRHQRRD